MKKTSKLILTLLTTAAITSLSSCDLFNQDYETRISGDFLYKYIKSSDAKITYEDGDYVAIYELSTEGLTKDTLIVPDEIDNKPVIKIGLPGSESTRNIFTGSPSFTSLYLPKSLEVMGCHSLCTNKKLFIIESDNYYIHGNKQHGANLYLPENLYNEYINYYDEEDLGLTSLHIANLEFISEGEVYFIGDYEEGDLISYVPDAPNKEGDYNFVGWYKEEECINEWDFTNDTFSLNEGETKMRLYAKFVEIDPTFSY